MSDGTFTLKKGFQKPMQDMLSEKAKGKQRAVDPEPGPSQGPPAKDLVIRFTEGLPDLTLQVAEGDAVRDIKRKVCRNVSYFRYSIA